MSGEEVGTRSKQLSELHENNVARLQASNRSVQMAEAKFWAVLWLIPPGLIYAIGWAAGWIRRGFAQPR